MFGPSLGALSGSGCVSMNRPSAPAAAAASASGGMNSRAPPLAPPAPCPGRCTLCVASKITGASQASRMRAKLAHVDDEIAVAEEGAALGDGTIGCRGCGSGRGSCIVAPSEPCLPRRAFPRGASTDPSSRSPLALCAPAATSRSVWRQRNAGICRTSTTSAAGAHWSGR